MASSSSPTGPNSKETLHRTLGAAAHQLISQAPGWQISDHGLQLSYGGDLGGGTMYYQSPASETTGSANHTYGHGIAYTNNPTMSFDQNSYSGSGSYGAYGPQYNINDLLDPVFEANQANLIDQYAGQRAHEHHADDNSDSDLDSEGDGSRNAVQVFQGVIRNEDHYKDTLSRRLRKATLDDQVADLPKTEEEQKELVKALFESIIDTIDVLDKPSKNGKPAQAVRRFRSGYYSSKDIELKCWEIMIWCRDAAMGVKLPGLDAKSKKEDYEGFRPRFQKILDSCRISKALCKQIMDPTYISRLVAAPGAEIQMKFNNKKINAERDIQNEIGRKAVKRGLKLNDLERLIGAEVMLPPPTSSPVQQDIQIKLDDAVALATTYDTSKQEIKSTPKTPRNITIPKKAAQTATTLNKTSTKRKSSSSANVSKNNDLFDDNNDEDYYETPAKRARSSKTHRPRLAKAAAKPRRGRNANPLPASTASSATMTSNDQESAMGQNVSQELGEPTGLDNTLLASSYEPQVQNIAAGNSTSSLEALPNAGGNIPMDTSIVSLEATYKSAICTALGVDSQWSDQYSLHQLRTYARAYNTEFSAIQWCFGPIYSGIGFTLFKDGVFYCQHFAQKIPVYRAFAIARGDLTEDGQVLQNGPRMGGFGPETDLMIRQALGIAPNDFGLFDDLCEEVVEDEHYLKEIAKRQQEA